MESLEIRVSTAKAAVQSDQSMTWDEVKAWNDGFDQALEIFHRWLTDQAGQFERVANGIQGT